MSPVIRKIEPKDNAPLAAVIRKVMLENGVPTCGSAYADPELDRLSQAYDDDRSVYFVVEANGEIKGGAGVAPLKGGDGDTCELQKMYLDHSARGTGLGAQLMQQSVDFAQSVGFKKIYLETMPQMVSAQRLYAKSGFEPLSQPMGDTGHSACHVWMVKTIAP